MDEEIVTEIGLLLTQLRYARRALEDIERSTAKYGGVTFAVALAAGPRFGEPPLMSGALKVYVTNINDLTVGRGALGFFEGIFGGIGRFFGGLVGGLAGGVIGGVSLWVWVGKLQDIVKGINDILERVGMGRGGTAAGGDKEKAGASDWATSLKRLDPIFQSLTALFEAAASGPKEAGAKTAETTSADARQWGDQLAVMLKAATTALDALDKIVKGLTVFVPILIGALASLLVRLDDIKLAILDLLQFVLRVALLLRGAALVTIYDTISAVAKLGADILGYLKDAFKTILESVLAMIGSIFSTLEAFITFIGSGLQKAMNAVLTWLVEGLGRVLTYIGDLRIFRLLTHLIQVLPAMLPALVTLVHGSEVSISGTGMEWLKDIKGKTIPGPTGAALTGKLPKEVEFPDVGKKFLEDIQPFKDALKKTSDLLPEKTGKAFDAAKDGLTKVDKRMQEALTTGEATFNKQLTEDMKKVGSQANALAGELTPAVKAATDLAKAGEADAGLRAIAVAYQEWLKSDGLKQIVSQISAYFATAKTAEAPGGAAAIPAAAVDAARPEAAKATVEIGEIVIDLKPAKPEVSSKSTGKRTSFLGDGLPPGHDEDLQRLGA